jgi:outer membrane protein
VKAGQAQVAAAETALKGAQAEYVYGLRTTLDVLISDENLRAAQLTLAQSRHDALLAEAAVLDASGRLEAKDLLPAEPAYDPQTHFDRVKNAARPPWEPVVQAVDELGAPGAAARP